METMAAEPPRSPWAANLLEVPGRGFTPLDSDSDDCEAGTGIRPKSSPLPRRRTSSSEDESEGAQWEMPPAPGSRRVSFADAKGLRLVLVKEFDARDFPKPRGFGERREEGPDAERGFSYVLSSLNLLAGSPEELGHRVREQKIELESVELLPGTTVLKGVVRVLNVSFHKTVFVRTTLDAWASHFDLLAEYIQGSSDGETDCFSFKLTLVPPFEGQGARVDFCLRYETPVGTFWANNCGKNYVLICQQRVREEAETRDECACRKSCLKAAREHFTTVDNSSLEMNIQSEEKMITGVLKNEGVLTLKSSQVTDSLNSATSEEERPKLPTESSQKISNRRNRRRAARQAKVKDMDLTSPKDPKAERVINNEPSLVGPPSDSTMQDRNLVIPFLDPTLCCGGSSAQVDGNREVTETGAIQADLEENLPQKQLSAAFITGMDWQRPLLSMGQSDGISDKVCIANNTREESQSDVRLPENTEVPVNTPDGFTFGTVLAPLYPLVCGQVIGVNPNLADQSKSGTDLSRMGDLLVSSSLTVNNEDPFKSHVGNSMSAHLKDVPTEGSVCGSVAADTSTNAADAGCQESEHECTGTHANNPEPATDEDTPPSDVNDEMVKDASTTRAGLGHQGNPGKGPQALGCQRMNLYEMQVQEEAAMPTTEAGEICFDNQMRFNPTQALSQPTFVQETTHATSQTPWSLLVTACENQATDSEIRSEEATDFIRTDTWGEQAGVPPTMTVSTTHAYPEQGTEREQLDELDQDCLMVPARFEAAGTSAGDQSIPELEDGQECSVLDLSQETNETSMEVVEEPDNEGNDSTNDLEEGNTTPTVEHEPSVDVSECIRVNMTSCTHSDMLAKETTPVEKLVCVQAEAEEHSEVKSEDAATEEDFFGPREERTEDINWEMMVEEEEKDEEGEEVMRTEKAEKGEEEVLKDKQSKTELPPLGNIVGYEKREHMEMDSEGQVEFETVEEPFICQGQKGEDKKGGRDADHGADNQHDVWEKVRNREKEILAEADQETQVQVEDNAERTSIDEEVDGAGEEGVPVETVEECVIGTEESNKKTQRLEMGSHPSQNKVESAPSTPISNVHECEVERVIDEKHTPENETACFPTEMQFISEEEVRGNTYRLQRTDGQPKALSESARYGSDSWAAETGSRSLTEEPDCDEASEGNSSSSESLSDEEMELYLHRLRAAPCPQTLRSFPRDGGAMTGSQRGKRPSIDRPRFLPTSMPPISESVNEDQLTRTPGSPEEMGIENFQDDCRQFPPQDNQGNGGLNTAQWISAFSCRNILKSLLCITMLAVFLVVGYHYDFLACFALYLLSICWLYCRSDSQSVQSNKVLT